MERAPTSRVNEQWSMGIASDAPFDGRRIRALTLVDNDAREALAIVVDSGIRGSRLAVARQPIRPSVRLDALRRLQWVDSGQDAATSRVSTSRHLVLEAV
ncbi:hypothetical protein [Roseomonas sp. CAU 1739]|uniref:hypothetical protein n=1 Tax=Roseomonas sp. CAU 1739 TaxID=3140364 RepID=UPI0038D157E6